jgi:hypothetical protein
MSLNLNLNSERTSLKIFGRGAFIVIHSQMTVGVATLLQKDLPTLTVVTLPWEGKCP